MAFAQSTRHIRVTYKKRPVKALLLNGSPCRVSRLTALREARILHISPKCLHNRNRRSGCGFGAKDAWTHADSGGVG